MKKLFLLLFLLHFVSYGQKADGLEICFEVQKSLKGFAADKEADDALDEILAVIGAAKNFYLIPCDEINNALALTYKGERFILYDKDFIDRINKATNDWSGKFILAHEVGHHINGHTRDFLIASVLDDQTKEKQREEELEADEFAGFIVAKLGAKYNQIKELINTIAPEKDDKYSTHPNRSKRLEAIKKGFDKVKIISKSNNQKKPSKSTIEKTNSKITNVRSDWTYEIEKPYAYWKEQLKDNPFQWKKLEKNMPLIIKTSRCSGELINKTGNVKLSLIIKQKKLKFNHEYNNSFAAKTILREQLPYKSIEIWFYGGPFSPLLSKTNIPNYVHPKEKEDQDNRVYSDEWEKNDKEAKQRGYPELAMVTGKIKYIVDDDFSGEFEITFPRNDRESGLNKADGINIDLPIRYGVSGTIRQTRDIIEDIKEIKDFLYALKKGKKLFIQLSNYRNDYYSFEADTQSGWYYDPNISNDTYEFDLSGSSKALQLD